MKSVKLGYVNIEAWMYDLGLSNPRELMAYAVIYGFSQDGVSVFRGGRAYLAAATLSNSLSTVDTVLDTLKSKGLIYPVEENIKGVRFVNYRAVLDTASKIGVVHQILGEGSTEIGATTTIGESNNNSHIESAPAKKTVKRFVAPTPEEVTAYAATIDFELDGATFVDFYTARGWMIGKNPMKDWKAAVRTWKSRRASEPGPGLFTQPSRPVYQAPAREGLAGHNARVLAEALNMNPYNNPINPEYDEQ